MAIKINIHLSALNVSPIRDLFFRMAIGKIIMRGLNFGVKGEGHPTSSRSYEHNITSHILKKIVSTSIYLISLLTKINLISNISY